MPRRSRPRILGRDCSAAIAGRARRGRPCASARRGRGRRDGSGRRRERSEPCSARPAQAAEQRHPTADGLSGLALLDEVLPHAAIVDVGLPGIDGLELARRVRASPLHQHIYLVALTGYGQDTNRKMALEASFGSSSLGASSRAGCSARLVEHLGDGGLLQPAYRGCCRAEGCGPRCRESAAQCGVPTRGHKP